MLRLEECIGRREAGPKAERLARARGLGLAVPPGVVVLPDEVLDERGRAALGAAALALGAGPFAVRSSAALEDGAGRSGAGLFLTRLGVAAELLAEAVAEVRGSGRSAEVLRYFGAEVAVAVLLQPMVPAERLGVLQVRLTESGAITGAAVEERPCDEPESGAVEHRELDLEDRGEAELLLGARMLATLLIGPAEGAATGPRAPENRDVQIEYARGSGGVTFLQVRPMPSPAANDQRGWPPPPCPELVYVQDREHNPDPLSVAQAGLVDLVEASGVSPGLRQCVRRGYLYCARTAPPGESPDASQAALPNAPQAAQPNAPQTAQPNAPQTTQPGPPQAAQTIAQQTVQPNALPVDLPTAAIDLPRRFTTEILPACDQLLAPLEAQVRLLAQARRAGLLSSDIAPPPWGTGPLASDTATRAPAVPLPAALHAYLGVYRWYVTQIAPALALARRQLDQILTAGLGEGLSQHPELVAGLPSVTARRMQALWQLGNAAQPDRPGLLDAYFQHYGAFSPTWDVALPCDDEVPERVLATAAAIAGGPAPAERLQQAVLRHRVALAALCSRLPDGGAALCAALPIVRAALSIAEDDDALFFRAQRLLRWALLGVGAELQSRGRLTHADQVFALPLSVVLDRPGAAGPDDGVERADLVVLADQGRRRQEHQRRLLPPLRFVAGRPVWPALSAAAGERAELRGLGVPAPDPAPVRGSVRVIRSLDQSPALWAGGADLSGAVLVLPVLLPSWAPFLLLAAAVVTDHGGALSHGAILAREAGLPAVLSTGTATRALRDGMTVIVDAAAGRVYWSIARAGAGPGDDPAGVAADY